MYYLNTSHVNVNLLRKDEPLILDYNLNTSHVNVNLKHIVQINVREKI